MVEESMWGFRVLICKTKELNLGCKKEEKERFLLCLWAVWIVL